MMHFASGCSERSDFTTIIHVSIFIRLAHSDVTEKRTRDESHRDEIVRQMASSRLLLIPIKLIQSWTVEYRLTVTCVMSNSVIV